MTLTLGPKQNTHVLCPEKYIVGTEYSVRYYRLGICRIYRAKPGYFDLESSHNACDDGVRIRPDATPYRASDCERERDDHLSRLASSSDTG
jgi:hypothetical protein